MTPQLRWGYVLQGTSIFFERIGIEATRSYGVGRVRPLSAGDPAPSTKIPGDSACSVMLSHHRTDKDPERGAARTHAMACLTARWASWLRVHSYRKP
jgi:hypothetical protein